MSFLATASPDLLPEVLDLTYPLWGEGLSREGYERYNAAQARTPWGRAHLRRLVLMDGGSVTAPNLAFWTEDGWRVENEGVPPDIEVEQNPADVIAGRDPQLDRAIQVVMDELKKNPPVKPKRPAFRSVPKERARR